MIIEINKPEVLYFILTRFNKVIIFFTVDWKSDCFIFNRTYIDTSRDDQYSNIAFCRVNLDLIPYIRELYNVNIYKTPYVVFIRDGEIVNELYGNKPDVFKDLLYDL